jgi:hypothetical protein
MRLAYSARRHAEPIASDCSPTVRRSRKLEQTLTFILLPALLLAGCDSKASGGVDSSPSREASPVRTVEKRTLTCASSGDAFTWETTKPWLQSMLCRVGVPEDGTVAARQLHDTGTALDVTRASYAGRLSVFINAGPPDPEHDPRPHLERTDQDGPYALYVGRSESTYVFHAESPSLWVSLYAYSNSKTPIIWRPRNAVVTWFGKFVEHMAKSPPPVC